MIRTGGGAVALFAVAVLWLCSMVPAASGEGVGDDHPTPALVTQEVLESRIAAIESGPDGADESKSKLLDLYKQSLENLKEAQVNAESAGAFRHELLTAPTQTESIEKALAESPGLDAAAELEVGLSTPSSELIRLVQKEQAELAAVDARRADLERRLDEQAARPALVRQRLDEAVALGGLSPDLGHVLFQQRQTLPDRRPLRHQAAERWDRLAALSLQRLQHRHEAKRIDQRSIGVKVPRDRPRRG